MNKIFFSIFLVFSLSSYAAKVEPIGTPMRSVSASGIEVPVYEKVGLTGTSKTPVELKLTGGGVREKKVVIASVNVYLLLSYTDLNVPLDAGDPLKSLSQSRNRLLRMTFLRDVDAEKIRNSFADALKENGVSLEDPAMKKLLDALQFDVKKGGGVELIGLRPATGMEKVQMVFPTKTIESEGKTLVSDFWKIWFGKPADGGLEDLKPRLLSLDQLMHM